MDRKYGAVRDVHDVRDRMYRVSHTLPKLPPLVDLREWAGPIKDQGSTGKCTGMAFSSAREWMARRYEKKSPILSGLSLYIEELVEDGDFPNDNGAMPRTGCRMLTQKGVCEVDVCPDGAVIQVLTHEQEINALKWKTGAYHRMASLDNVLTCLADPTPWPVPVAFTVYESFESDTVANTGIMPVPLPGERQLGGHEVLCLGYDMTKQMAIIQNSWGDSWGDHGYFWMPFSVLSDPSSDLWICHTGKPW